MGQVLDQTARRRPHSLARPRRGLVLRRARSHGARRLVRRADGGAGAGERGADRRAVRLALGRARGRRGGGTGVLLRTLLATYEHLHGTLFDLPQVVESVEPAERFTIVRGNMFDDPIPATDAHILSQIIHGWPDAGAAQILRRCTEAAPRILLVEGVLPKRPSAGDASFDLFMLTLTGGRQRTEDEFRRLAESIGLELRSTQPLAAGNSLIELHVA